MVEFLIIEQNGIRLERSIKKYVMVAILKKFIHFIEELKITHKKYINMCHL